jgi:hypothetical protein
LAPDQSGFFLFVECFGVAVQRGPEPLSRGEGATTKVFYNETSERVSDA